MTLKNLFPSFGYSPATDKPIKVSISDLLLPQTVKANLNFTVTTYLSNTTKVNQGTFSFNGSIVPGKIERINSVFSLQ